MSYWLRAKDYGRATLGNTISDTDTLIISTSGVGGNVSGRFPAASSGNNNFILTIWDTSLYRSPVEALEASALEKVLVTSINYNSPLGLTEFTVTRGYDGTTAKAWTANNWVQLWLCDNAAVISEIQAALDAHTHTGGAQKVGASALTPESVDAAGHIAAATHLTAQTYAQVGLYLRGYNDASALYAGATGGVLELTQGVPASGVLRSRMLMWCRDGIIGGAQIACAPVHQAATAYMRFALMPKGTHASGAGFTCFGDSAQTRWADWYVTTTDAGVGVQTGISTYTWRNGHLVTSTPALQLDLATSLLTFRGDAIVGRGAANRIDIGTAGAPDNLMVWGSQIEVGPTVRIDRDQDNSLGLAAGDQIWADNMLALARANLVERIYDICDPANIRALWIPDGRTGTTLKDWSGNARHATVNTDLTTAVSGHCRYLPVTSDAHYWEVADADWLSFGNGSTDTAFTVLSLLYPLVEAGSPHRTIFGKANFTTDLEALEYRISWSGDYFWCRYYDNSTGGHIGRRSSVALANNTWQVVEASYDGSATNAGCKLYVGNTQVDTTNSSSGPYTAMENLGSPAGCYYLSPASTAVPSRGRNAVTLLLTGTLTTAQRARLNVLLLGFAGSSIV